MFVETGAPPPPRPPPQRSREGSWDSGGSSRTFKIMLPSQIFNVVAFDAAIAGAVFSDASAGVAAVAGVAASSLGAVCLKSCCPLRF